MSDHIDPLRDMREMERKLSEAVTRRAMLATSVDYPIPQEGDATIEALKDIRRRIREAEQQRDAGWNFFANLPDERTYT